MMSSARMTNGVSITVIVMMSHLLFQEVTATHPYSWTPSISLTDDSGEPDGNGFCPYIPGFGKGLNCGGPLQAHSCKPQGADTQFAYDTTRNSIYSVNYNSLCDRLNDNEEGDDSESMGPCMTVVDDRIEEGARLKLTACDPESPFQNWKYSANGQFQILSLPEEDYGDTNGVSSWYCLTVGREVRSAGGYWASDLMVTECTDDDLVFTQWTLNKSQVGSSSGPGGDDNNGNINMTVTMEELLEEEEAEEMEDNDDDLVTTFNTTDVMGMNNTNYGNTADGDFELFGDAF